MSDHPKSGNMPTGFGMGVEPDVLSAKPLERRIEDLERQVASLKCRLSATIAIQTAITETLQGNHENALKLLAKAGEQNEQAESIEAGA